MHKGHTVNAENALQLRLGIQVIENDLTGIAAPNFYHHAQAILIGLVAQLANALDTLFFYQLSNLFDQSRLVELVRNFSDDDFLATLVVGFDLGSAAHINATSPSAVGLHDARTAINNAAGGEVWALHMLHQIINADVFICQHRQTGVNHLG